MDKIQLFDKIDTYINTNNQRKITGAIENMILKDIVEYADTVNTSISGIVTDNNVVITDNVTELIATTVPSTIGYNDEGVYKSLIAPALTLPAKPLLDARFDLLYIDTNVEPNVLSFKVGDVSDNPVQPTPLEGEIPFKLVYVDANSASVTSLVNEKTIYVGLHGNDTSSNNGLTIGKAVRTLTRAFQLLNPNGIKTITCLDNGSYTVPTFVTSTSPIFMNTPNISITGMVLLPSNYRLVCNNIATELRITNLNNHIKINTIYSLLVSTAGQLYQSGTTVVTNLTVVGNGKLYCNNLVVTGTISISPTATVQGMINGVIYPTVEVNSGSSSSGISVYPAPTFVDNGDGTGTFGATKAKVYDNANFVDIAEDYDVAQSTLTFTNGLEQYACINYNAGTPVYGVSNTLPNDSDSVLVYTIWRTGNELHSCSNDSLGLGLANKLSVRNCEVDRYKRANESGLLISESNRVISLTQGYVYAGTVKHNVLSFISSTDLLTKATVANGTWTYTNGTTYDNLNYNPITGEVPMTTSSKWSVRWFYRSIGDVKQIYYVESASQYNSTAACDADTPRQDLPAVIRGHCILVGKSYIKYNTAQGQTYSLFTATYSGITAIDHNLGTISKQGGDGTNYYHTGKEIDTASSVQYDTVEYNGTKYVRTPRYVFNDASVRIGTNYGGTALLNMRPLLTTQKVLNIRNIAGQTADNINVEDSGGTNVLFKVDVNGYTTAPRFYVDTNKYMAKHPSTNAIIFVIE